MAGATGTWPAPNFTGAWPGPIFGDSQTKNAFQFDPSRDTGGWSGYFGDALSAWVTVEGLKSKTNATGAAQEETRSATNNYPGGASTPARGGGLSGIAMNPQALLVGGLLIAGAYLVMK